MNSKSIYERAAEKADEIEAELKRIGYWQQQPLKPEAYRFKRPFAGDTMAFSQWLQFIFLERVRKMAAEKGETPKSSMVGAYAVRELDGDAKADQLVSLLSEFDSIFGRPTFSYGTDGTQPGGGGRRGRFGPLFYAMAWTGLMGAVTVLLFGYGYRLAPKVHRAVYSFSVHEPASGGYETIEIGAIVEGEKLPAALTRKVTMVVYTGRSPVPGAELAIDPESPRYSYKDAAGREQSGPPGAAAFRAWLGRCGIKGEEIKLAAEAKGLASLSEDLSKDPAAVFAAVRSGQWRGVNGAFGLSAKDSLVFSQPGKLPVWVKVGAPAVVWGIGLGALLFFVRRGRSSQK